MLVPVIGIVQVGVMAHADRFTYLPHIGLFLAVVWTAAEVARSSELLRRAVPAVAVIALVVFAVIGFFQVGLWRDSVTLFEHTVRISPDSTHARVNLGTAYNVAGRPDLAELQFRRTLEINPRSRLAKSNLGGVLMTLKRPEEAAHLFQELVDAEWLEPKYHVMLGFALCEQGKVTEAAFHAQEALRIDPNHERAKALIVRCRNALPAGS
jgi:Tfp pilus assembly protein PilF